MVGLTHGVEESKQTATRMDSLESQVSRITGPLEKILNSIQIDNVRLMPEARRIEAGPQSNRDVSQEYSIPSDLHVDIPMDEDDNQDSGSALLSSSIPGTVTTPSDQQEDVRMEEAPLPAPAPVPPAAPIPPLTPANAVSEPAITSAAAMPPPAPVLNLIPPTPQGSQEQATAAVPIDPAA